MNSVEVPKPSKIIRKYVINNVIETPMAKFPKIEDDEVKSTPIDKGSKDEQNASLSQNGAGSTLPNN